MVGETDHASHTEIRIRPDDLEFDDNLVLDQQFGGEFANDHAVVKDNASPLPNRAEPALSHLVAKGIFGTFSTIPRPSALAPLKALPMRPFGHRRQQPRIPFISTYPANPP
jgi:hypothetical protein